MLAPSLADEGRAGALEADFQQFYGLDLRALLGSYDLGRAAALAANLPRESRTMRALDPRLAWSAGDYILARAANEIAFMRYEQRGGKGRRPAPVKPPAEPARRRRGRLEGVSDERIGSLLFSRRESR